MSTTQNITMADAEKDFAIAAHIADENGSVVVLTGNRQKYKLTNLDIEPDLELTNDEKINVVASRILKRFKPAFLELAK